jgi:hypothetical protein
MLMSIKHGWYSNKMKDQNKFTGLGKKKNNPISNIYERIDGKEVEVTIVSDKNENYGGANIRSFPDLVYVGELKGHVRPIFN